MNIYFENFLKAIRHQEVSQVPVAIFNVAPFTTSFTGTNIQQYYLNPALKMEAQLKLNEMLPEIIMIPALWADFGPVVECSAFGSEILWFEDQPPFLKRTIDTYEDINRIKPINPEKDGLMPVALDHYRYMWNHIDSRKVNEYGYLDGVAVTMGPIETSGLLIDFQNFFLGIYDAPTQIKKLIEIATDSILLWIQAQEKVNGRLKQLILIDHMPAQVSADTFMEFCFPYLKKIFQEYSYGIRIYHNEGNISHILPRIRDLGVDILHFGVDVKKAKETIGNNVALMGNINPVDILLEGNPAQVKEECIKCLKVGAPGGGFILSSGGGLAPKTPKENIEAMLEATRIWKTT